MKLKVKRVAKKEKYTIGQLYVDGKYFCDTLEDKDRGLNNKMTAKEVEKIKVYGETAIPTGTYYVDITYSSTFKRFLPLVKNVPGYAGIRIHSGNTAKDTLGCILVGQNKEVGKVINSRDTFNKLFSFMQNEKNITLTIE